MRISKSKEKKFQQKIKLKSASELLKRFPLKDDLNNGYLKEYFRNLEIVISEINKIEKIYCGSSIKYPLFQQDNEKLARKYYWKKRD